MLSPPWGNGETGVVASEGMPEVRRAYESNFWRTAMIVFACTGNMQKRLPFVREALVFVRIGVVAGSGTGFPVSPLSLHTKSDVRDRCLSI